MLAAHRKRAWKVHQPDSNHNQQREVQVMTPVIVPEETRGRAFRVRAYRADRVNEAGSAASALKQYRGHSNIQPFVVVDR